MEKKDRILRFIKVIILVYLYVSISLQLNRFED